MTRTAMAIAISAVMGTVLGLSAMPTLASAQSRLPGQTFDPSREAPPLVVRKRAFTDSGTAVQPGYEHEYLTEQTTLNRPVYSSFAPDRFGQDVLPRPFDGLGLY